MPSSPGLPPPARLRRFVAVAIIGAAVLSAAGSGPSDPVEAALANSLFDPTPRTHGAVTVIGDSVLQGSVIVGPTLVDRLGENGWGPIRARAGVGYSTGAFASTTEAKSTYWINLWRSQGWDAPNVFVNLGANDSGRCNIDLGCARNAILHLVNAIGPGHRIWWPQITRHPLFQHQADDMEPRAAADRRRARRLLHVGLADGDGGRGAQHRRQHAPHGRRLPDPVADHGARVQRRPRTRFEDRRRRGPPDTDGIPE